MKLYLLFCFIFSLNAAYIFPNKIKHCGIEHCDVDNMDACCNICFDCKGEGKNNCDFCHGTGFLMLNGDLIGTNNKCVVCNGSGEKICKKCMGAGKIARWRIKYKNFSF